MTTIVNLSALEAILGGYGPVDSGFVSAQYWAGGRAYVSVVGDEVRLPSEIRVAIVDGETVPLALEPTDGKCCVRWEVRDIRTRHRLIRYTDIPDVAEVDFGDLTDVDPSTFEPSAAGQAAWDAAVAAAQAAVSGAVSARDVAVASAADAVDAAAAAVPAASDAVAAASTATIAAGEASTAAGDAVSASDAAVAARVAAEAAAAEAVAVPVTNDGIMAVVLADPDSASSQQLVETIVEKGVESFTRRAQSPLRIFDVRDHLAEGQSLPDAGQAGMPALLQAAADAAAAWVASGESAALRPGGIPTAVYVPAGLFTIGTSVVVRSKVGIVGEGVSRTIFNLTNGAGLQKGTIYDTTPVGGWTDAHFLDDLVYDGFTVECKDSVSVQDKPFWMQNLRRPSFNNVAVRNSRTTAFGIDFIIDARFDGCTVYRAGARGDEATNTLGATYSGFGFGTGRFQDEGAVLTNCLAEWCVGAGFYVEQVPSRGAFLAPTGFQMVNCHSRENRYGFSAYGCGLTIANSWFYKNRAAGGIITGSGDVAPAHDGAIIGSVFAENGYGSALTGIAGGHGVVFGYRDNDGWRFTDTLFMKNQGAGIAWDVQSRPGAVGPRVARCNFLGNAYGVLAPLTHTKLRALTLSENTFKGNLIAAVSAPGGLVAPHIVNNDFISELIGIQWSANYPSIAAIVTGNTFTDCAVDQQNTPSDNARITGNITRQSILAKVTTLAGAAPAWFIDDRSNTTRPGLVSPAVSLAQPMTYYCVVDQIPDPSMTFAVFDPGSTVAFSRTSTNWRFRAQHGGGALFQEVAGGVSKAVMCATQTDVQANFYVQDLGSDTDTMVGYNALSVSAPEKRSRCAAFIAFTGVHDATTRNAIMAALKTEYNTI